MSVRVQPQKQDNFKQTESDHLNTSIVATLGTAGTIVACVVGGAILFLNARYKVSKPDQYIVRTGLGISDMSVSRKAIVWPFQSCKIISPFFQNFTFFF